MLTPEERQRIEDEERRKLAEEKYRAEVRAKLKNQNSLAPEIQPAPSTKPNRTPWMIGIGVALLVAIILLTANLKLFRNSPSDRSAPPDEPSTSSPVKPAPAPQIRYVPVSTKIATGQIIVKARGYVQYRFTITPEMVEPTITGTFNASGGKGNDIEAAIADEADFVNWINGHRALVSWTTPGRETTGRIEVKLKPGAYVLAFNNRFSAFRDKQVFLDIDLHYSKQETTEATGEVRR
jgi:hypothetical protein